MIERFVRWLDWRRERPVWPASDFDSRYALWRVCRPELRRRR